MTAMCLGSILSPVNSVLSCSLCICHYESQEDVWKKKRRKKKRVLPHSFTFFFSCAHQKNVACVGLCGRSASRKKDDILNELCLSFALI